MSTASLFTHRNKWVWGLWRKGRSRASPGSRCRKDSRTAGAEDAPTSGSRAQPTRWGATFCNNSVSEPHTHISKHPHKSWAHSILSKLGEWGAQRSLAIPAATNCSKNCHWLSPTFIVRKLRLAEGARTWIQADQTS